MQVAGAGLYSGVWEFLNPSLLSLFLLQSHLKCPQNLRVTLNIGKKSRRSSSSAGMGGRAGAYLSCHRAGGWAYPGQRQTETHTLPCGQFRIASKPKIYVFCLWREVGENSSWHGHSSLCSKGFRWDLNKKPSCFEEVVLSIMGQKLECFVFECSRQITQLYISAANFNL